MRLVATIPHPQCRIAIMSYNDKWIIEIEAGQYKQTFKIGHDSVNGLEEVKQLVTRELMQGSLQRFSSMHADFAEAFKHLQQKQ